MDAEQMKALTAPFPPEEEGYLPRVTCRACSDSKGAKHCAEHRARVCDTCHAFVSERHIHLTYIGHAGVTKRLLEVDPSWSWVPMGVTEGGLPLFDANGGLWIRLTVAGVSRLGYGDMENGKGPKEAIGDALRNAAMRFGVALDLWSKSEAFEFKPLETTGAPQEPAPAPSAPAAQGTPETGSEAHGGEASIGQARLQPDEEPVSGTTPPVAIPEATPAEQAGGEATSGTSADEPPAAAGDYDAPASEEQWEIAREHIGAVPTILGRYQKRFGSRKKKDEITNLELAELIEEALKKVSA